MPNRIVLATRNEHKDGELLAILGDVVAELDLEVVGLSAYPDLPDVVEDGVTFAANATKNGKGVAIGAGENDGGIGQRFGFVVCCHFDCCPS